MWFRKINDYFLVTMINTTANSTFEKDCVLITRWYCAYRYTLRCNVAKSDFASLIGPMRLRPQGC